MGLKSPNKASLVRPDDSIQPAQPAPVSTSPAGSDACNATKAGATLSRGRRRVAWYALGIVLIACIGGVAAALGIIVPRWIDRPDRALLGGSPGDNITLVCQATRYPERCRTSLTGDPRSRSGGPAGFLVLVSVDQGHAGVGVTLETARWFQQRETDAAVVTALNDCEEVLTMAVERLTAVTDAWDDGDPEVLLHWLSAVLTWQTDCWNAMSKPAITSVMQNSTMVNQANDTMTLLSNSVAMTSALANFGPDPGRWLPPGAGRGDGLEGGSEDGGGYSAAEVASDRYGDVDYKPDPRIMPVGNGWRKLLSAGGGYPDWLSTKDRRILQSASLSAVVPSVTVAKTGVAQFRTVQAAVDASPARSATRWVIYIKAGIYTETVIVPSNRTNLMFLGDGVGRTIITGSRNVMMPNVTTFNSATVAVNADGFLAYGMTFENTAGPDNHQAVALRLDSDLAALQNCSILGYQDTLYTHTLRQFFTQCMIQGTIDFIFGNSASVFQNCQVQCRLGNPQVATCLLTAQGRTDPAQNTGYVFQNCTANGTLSYMQAFLANPSQNKAYLGRPWKLYSRTIYSRTLLESLIQPEGWLPWDGTFALSTLFYGEFASYGPGARNLTARVPWSTQLTLAQVQPYTVTKFIQGNQWLPLKSVPFADM